MDILRRQHRTVHKKCRRRFGGSFELRQLLSEKVTGRSR